MFTQIKGIGKKTSDKLVELGFQSFGELASMTAHEVRSALEDHGVKVVGEPQEWIDQAKRLAEKERTAGLPLDVDADDVEQWDRAPGYIPEDGVWVSTAGLSVFDGELQVSVTSDTEVGIFTVTPAQFEALVPLRDTLAARTGNSKLTLEGVIASALNALLREYGYPEIEW